MRNCDYLIASTDVATSFFRQVSVIRFYALASSFLSFIILASMSCISFCLFFKFIDALVPSVNEAPSKTDITDIPFHSALYADALNFGRVA